MMNFWLGVAVGAVLTIIGGGFLTIWYFKDVFR